MSKIIIIGKGESVTRSTAEFVDSHDMVIIVNKIVYNGYEHLISKRADVIFGNRTSLRYSKGQVKEMGLKEAIFTGKSNQSFVNYLDGVKLIYPKPNLGDAFKQKYGFDPSSGLQALYHTLSNRNPTEITLIGFDFYEVGSKPYYFKPSEVEPELRYLWDGDYKNDVINKASGHNTDKSIDYLERVIIDNPEIKFNIISNSSKVNKFEYENCNILNEG